MLRDARRWRWMALAALFSAAWTAPGLAKPKDAAAQRLDKAAMNDDFLAVRFDRAAEKLRRALKECGGKGCESKQVVKLHVHLGIILVNAGQKDAAAKAFADALKLDPGATPDKDFLTADIEAAFAAGRSKAGLAVVDKSSAPTSMKHEPVTESRIHLPIPIFVGGVPAAAKYLLVYRSSEDGPWTKIRLKKMGKYWGAMVRCRDTHKVGTISYYVVAEDEEGEPVASVGSKKQPLDIELKKKVAGEPLSFPDEEPPSVCKADDACPAGSDEPGCGPDALAEGAPCTGAGQCSRSEGLACIEGSCRPGEEPAGDFDKNWLSLGLSVDWAVIAGTGLCSPDHTNATYTCVRSDARVYKAQGAADTGSSAGPPLALGTVRILVGYDRIVAGNLAVGMRVGFAFHGGPALPDGGTSKAFFPWHIEPRLTYWIGDGVLARPGFRPYVYLGGGLSQVDAKLPGIPVSDDCDLQALCNGPRTPKTLAVGDDGLPLTHADGTLVYVTPRGVDVSTLPTKSPTKHIPVDVYRRMGTAMVDLGGGVMYAIDKHAGITFDLKLGYFFGSPGIAVSPTLGGMYGF